MALRINGTLVGTASVLSSAPADLIFNATVPATGGVVELVFLNGGLSRTASVRTLRVESLTVAGAIYKPTDSGVYFDLGEGMDAFDAQMLLPGHSVLMQSGALRFVVAPSATSGTNGNGTTTAPAPGYYVDARNGDDSGPGSHAQPWRTLARIENTQLRAGEGFFLRCGTMWRSTLKLNATQLSNGATVAGYGPDCAKSKAVITGADDFSSGWALNAGVWSRTLPAGTPKITQLFVDGLPLRTAQWPNIPDVADSPDAARVGAPGAGQMRFTALPGDMATLSGKDLAGATLQLRTQPWLIESRRVTQSNNGMLEVDRATDWPILAGQTYVLQDKGWMLDAPGEFFHDAAAQRLYLIAPHAAGALNLNAALIEGSVRDVGIDLSQRALLKVRDVSVRAARSHGLRMTNAPGATVEKIEAIDNGEAGVHLAQWEALPAGATASSLSDSLLAGNAQYGIDANYIKGAQISRNRVLSTGSAFQHQGGVKAAIAVGPGGQVTDNWIDGAGYNGVSFSTIGGSLVARNTVSSYCIRLSDCGAIYTWTGRANALVAQGSTVTSNRIFNSDMMAASPPAGGYEVIVGIYLDDFAQQVRVSDNTIVGAPFGIYLHNASNIAVERNRIWLPQMAAIASNMDQTDGDWLIGNRYAENEIVPRVLARLAAGSTPEFLVSNAIWLHHSLLGDAALAAHRNIYVNNSVLQLQGPLRAYARLSGPGGERWVDDQQWRALNPAEGSVRRPLRYSPLSIGLKSEKVLDPAFASGLANWGVYSNPSGSGFAMQPFADASMCTGMCMRMIAGHPGDLLGSAPFSVTAASLYVYSWSAAMPATGSATVGQPYVGRADSPWDLMADGRGFTDYLKRGGERSERVAFETFFVAKASATSRINLQLETLRTPVTFSGASVREVESIRPARLSEWIALSTASTDRARSIDCGDLGWPAGCSATTPDGQAVTLPVLQAAGTHRLLLRADSSHARRLP